MKIFRWLTDWQFPLLCKKCFFLQLRKRERNVNNINVFLSFSLIQFDSFLVIFFLFATSLSSPIIMITKNQKRPTLRQACLCERARSITYLSWKKFLNWITFFFCFVLIISTWCLAKFSMFFFSPKTHFLSFQNVIWFLSLKSLWRKGDLATN